MKFFNFLLPRNWGIVKVYRDFENYADWKRTIKKEQAKKDSKYNTWNLDRTKLYDIYVTTSIEEGDIDLPENLQRVRLMETLNPLHKYLDEELGFAECLDVEFNQFEDDDGNLSLTYLIVYRFKFRKFSLKWIAKFILFTGVELFLIFKFLIPWIQTLI